MSVASPQNRKEFKEYILTKLGKPVLQINVSDEQIDLAINDSFQYFQEREHFNGTDRAYYRVRVEEPFMDFFKTARLRETNQSVDPKVYAAGAVDELTMVDAGNNYSATTDGSQTRTNQPTELVVPSGTGEGLTVNWGEPRTVSGGIITPTIYSAGKGYSLGDRVILVGGDNDAIFEVTKIKDDTSLYGMDVIEQQRNWIILPDDVLYVTEVLNVRASANYITGGVIPTAAFTNPFLTGGVGGMNNWGGMQLDLISYYMMKEHLETMNFLLRPPISYDFNQRTHRLYLNSNTILKKGNYLVIECAIKPCPDVFPDLWNDRFMKRYTSALVKKQWGQNLTKYQQVQLPGGITMNGEMIYNEGVREISEIEQRFSMDEASPPLDMVG